jgi:spore germination protein PD
MDFYVTNGSLSVGSIELLAVGSASLFLIGDAQTIQLSSAFDTPPSSLIVSTTGFVPFAPKG